MQYNINFKDSNGSIIYTVPLNIPDEPGRYVINSVSSSVPVTLNRDEIVVNKEENNYYLTFIYQPGNIINYCYFTTNAIEDYPTDYPIEKAEFAYPSENKKDKEDNEAIEQDGETTFFNSIKGEIIVKDLSNNDLIYPIISEATNYLMPDALFMYTDFGPNEIARIAESVGYFNNVTKYNFSPYLFIINKSPYSVVEPETLDENYFNRDDSNRTCFYYDVLESFDAYRFFPGALDGYYAIDSDNPLKFVYFVIDTISNSSLILDQLVEALPEFLGVEPDYIEEVPLHIGNLDPISALDILVQTFQQNDYNNNTLFMIPGDFLTVLVQAKDQLNINVDRWFVCSMDTPKNIMDEILYQEGLHSQLDFHFYYTYPHVNYGNFDLVLSNIATEINNEINNGGTPSCNLRVVEFAPWVEVI